MKLRNQTALLTEGGETSSDPVFVKHSFSFVDKAMVLRYNALHVTHVHLTEELFSRVNTLLTAAGPLPLCRPLKGKNAIVVKLAM